MQLDQAEADRLIAVQKVRLDDRTWAWPAFGGSTVVPVVSEDRQDEFLLDINRGRIDLVKVTYQERCHGCIPLIRLDVRGPDHMNPDDEIIPCPHLHIFREGWGTKWAHQVPPDFTDTEDPRATLNEFLIYCRVIEPPIIDFGLFG